MVGFACFEDKLAGDSLVEYWQLGEGLVLGRSCLTGYGAVDMDILGLDRRRDRWRHGVVEEVMP